MVELIKRKKLENLILNIVAIAVSITCIILISNNYGEIFMEENTINSIESFDKLSKEKTYVNMDLTKAELTRFSLENKKTETLEANTYILEYNNEIIVLFLKPNSALTDKTKGKLIKPINEELEILKELERENKNKVVKEICFSNINYPSYESFYKYLFLALIVIIVLSVIFSIFDFIYFINPEKSYSYVKYLKKQQKAIYK